MTKRRSTEGAPKPGESAEGLRLWEAPAVAPPSTRRWVRHAAHATPAAPNPPARLLRLRVVGPALALLVAATGCANVKEYQNTRRGADGYDPYHAAAMPYDGFQPLATPATRPSQPREADGAPPAAAPASPPAAP